MPGKISPYITLALSAILCSCNSHSPKHIQTQTLQAVKAYYEDTVSSHQYGDSLLLLVTRHGDTLFKHYHDLTGLARHHFDDSFTATCYYKKCLNDTSIHSNLLFHLNDYSIACNSQYVGVLRQHNKKRADKRQCGFCSH